MAETTTELRKTALNAVHRAAKSKMVDFGGWDMPVDCRIWAIFNCVGPGRWRQCSTCA